jgi:hypothetical protein
MRKFVEICAPKKNLVRVFKIYTFNIKHKISIQ